MGGIPAAFESPVVIQVLQALSLWRHKRTVWALNAILGDFIRCGKP